MPLEADSPLGFPLKSQWPVVRTIAETVRSQGGPKTCAMGFVTRHQLEQAASGSGHGLGARQMRRETTSIADGDSETGFCAMILTIFSYLLIGITFPFSLCFCFKIVQVRLFGCTLRRTRHE